MRRDQSTTGGDYRREHNAEMWNREGLPAVVVPFLGHPVRNKAIAQMAVEEQEIGD